MNGERRSEIFLRMRLDRCFAKPPGGQIWVRQPGVQRFFLKRVGRNSVSVLRRKAIGLAEYAIAIPPDEFWTATTARMNAVRCGDRRESRNPDVAPLIRATLAVLSYVPLSVAPRDTYGLLFAVVPGDRYGLGWAARHIGSVRRGDSRRKPMCPIPGNIICIRVMGIA
jgi:hypothetical protein